MSATILLSTVTKELGWLRTELADFLQRTKMVHIRHQDDFFQQGVDTLHLLEKEIDKSNVVVHVIGAEPGWPMPAEFVDAFLARHPAFSDKFPDIAALGRQGTITATQWEAWLALYLKKHLCSYELPHKLEEGSAQWLHSQRLQQRERHPFVVEEDQNLTQEIVGSLMQLGVFNRTRWALTSAACAVAIVCVGVLVAVFGRPYLTTKPPPNIQATEPTPATKKDDKGGHLPIYATLSANDRLRLQGATKDNIVRIAGGCDDKGLQELAEKHEKDPEELLRQVKEKYLK